MMKILVACEESQAVCLAFRERGHEAYSCDLQECSGGHPEWHIVADVLTVINGGTFTTQAGTVVVIDRWDKMIAHPDCTYLTCSAEWAYKDPDFVRYPGVGYHQKLKPGTLFGEARRQARENALEFVCKLLNASIKEKVIENPIGVISTRIFWYIGGENGPAEYKVFPRKTIGIQPQVVQPHWFGDDASKATALYFVNCKKLKPTQHVQPRIVNGKKRWANQTDSGQNNLTPSADRAKQRSKTYPGLAKALAEQLG
jgi:hypothetical protein